VVVSQILLMIWATNGLLWCKADSRIFHGSFSSLVLCGICVSLILCRFSLWLKLDNISSGSTSVDIGISNGVIFYGENRG